jgi:hypothetical protein
VPDIPPGNFGISSQVTGHAATARTAALDGLAVRGPAQGPAAPTVIPAPVSSLTATLSGVTGHGLRANPDLFPAPEALCRPPHLQELHCGQPGQFGEWQSSGTFQLDFHGVCFRKILLTWSPLTESNRRPSPYHGDALPTELRGPVFSCLTWGFVPRGRVFRSCTAVIQRLSNTMSETSKTDARTTSVGEITVLLPSWRLHLEAANLSPPHDPRLHR